MTDQVQSILTSDIQRALEHAVVEANSAFDNPNNLITMKKKKKKRIRENDNTVEDLGRRKKKKKDNPKDSIPATASGILVSDSDAGITALTKPKKKKKGKRPERVTPNSPPQIDAQSTSVNSSSQDSTAAFLSAIVAAAAGTPELQSSSYLDSQPETYAQFSPQYPYDSHLPHPDHLAPTSFPTTMGLPFSELAFGGSNEDVLRALQDLDMSKIANVLKALGEAAAAANVPLGETIGVIPSTSIEQPPPLGQVPVASEDILGLPLQQGKTPEHRRAIDMSLPAPEHKTSVDHAHLLATKWLSASKLAELVRTEGLAYKKGKFSAIEEQQLKNAIETYRIQKSLSEEEINEIIFAKNDKNKDTAFWSDITSALPQRPIIAVYHHVRRTFHPMKQRGKWMPAEDANLKRAVADLGQQWEKVSLRVGRMSSDCRDRYRNHIVNRDKRVEGHWTKEEEDELTRIVTGMTTKQGKDFDNDIFWGKVSDLMGGKRGRQQCRIKWTDALSKTFKNEGQKPRWNQQDAYILVHKVDSLNVRDDSEIDWKTLPDPQWNFWSAHLLQRRFLTMKRSIKGHEDMTHREIMDILRVKKAQLPATFISSNRKRKVTSAPTIIDTEGVPPVIEAGSSTGLGTFTSQANDTLSLSDVDL